MVNDNKNVQAAASSSKRGMAVKDYKKQYEEELAKRKQQFSDEPGA